MGGNVGVQITLHSPDLRFCGHQRPKFGWRGYWEFCGDWL